LRREWIPTFENPILEMIGSAFGDAIMRTSEYFFTIASNVVL
jgi:hypothetical protein